MHITTDRRDISCVCSPRALCRKEKQGPYFKNGLEIEINQLLSSSEYWSTRCVPAEIMVTLVVRDGSRTPPPLLPLVRPLHLKNLAEQPSTDQSSLRYVPHSSTSSTNFRSNWRHHTAVQNLLFLFVWRSAAWTYQITRRDTRVHVKMFNAKSHLLLLPSPVFSMRRTSPVSDGCKLQNFKVRDHQH